MTVYHLQLLAEAVCWVASVSACCALLSARGWLSLVAGAVAATIVTVAITSLGPSPCAAIIAVAWVALALMQVGQTRATELRAVFGRHHEMWTFCVGYLIFAAAGLLLAATA